MRIAAVGGDGCGAPAPGFDGVLPGRDGEGRDGGAGRSPEAVRPNQSPWGRQRNRRRARGAFVGARRERQVRPPARRAVALARTAGWVEASVAGGGARAVARQPAQVLQSGSPLGVALRPADARWSTKVRKWPEQGAGPGCRIRGGRGEKHGGPHCGRAPNNSATRATERGRAEMVDAPPRPRTEASGVTPPVPLGWGGQQHRQPSGV